MQKIARVILITTEVNQQGQERLQQLAPDFRVVIQPAQKVEEIPTEIWQETEILLTLRTLPAPEQAPKLRWVQLFSAGANQVLTHSLFPTKTRFTTASGLHATNIAEYVMMMQLNWFHHMVQIVEWQQKAQWAPRAISSQISEVQELRGKTLGIVGYGSIGREVARQAHVFGMRIIALQRNTDHRDYGFIFPGTGDPEGALPERYYRPDQLHELLSESDVVVIGLPLTRATTHLFDRAAFEAMKPSAFLINIARGEICEPQALYEALEQRRIAGAALDVTSPEPLPADDPLWKLPNVIISPHVSGGTTAYAERVLQIFAANLSRYLAHETLYNEVDKTHGY
ncbi:D-2-hydroxyacid dehydrogenase [Tengunoibacter tsumagoiensis]|uniref:3-phosphoglycerate dehydrogenase n=1 Tax=Tengunoibacter tsumagoiensis TaxID=2014871 RepID=A0A401ZVA7_9CHLR|nr:D-2-hydroxyacid dehydrogenase [Tengunoibacter tsumagoiensis]GCE10823.1 3-phosphoglycerate dehydrogenase [Tengunoibacter tsumagoiensis]